MMAIASVAVLGGLILFAEGTQIHENVMATIDRFVNPRNDDISNGRFDLWKIYMDKLSKDFKLFLIGGTREDFGGMQAHNMFIEVVANHGILGTVIVCYLYTMVFLEIGEAVRSLGKRKIKLLGFIPFVLVFIVGMASHTLLGTEATANFCLGTAMIYFYGECNETENDSSINDNQINNVAELRRKRGKFKSLSLRNR